MRDELISQYRASLKMLMNAIHHCPEELWGNANYGIPYWQIVYHSLHFTNLYISPDEASFTPWSHHLPGIHQLDNRKDFSSILVDGIYLKADLQNYAEQIFTEVEFKIYQHDLKASSGFEWLPMNKFELHLYNLRHLQHHIGQLVGLLRATGVMGIEWISNFH